MEIDTVVGHKMTMRVNNQQQEPDTRMLTRLGNDVSLRRHPMELLLFIRSAEGIDDDPVVLGRKYAVVYWIEPDEVYRTRPVETWLNNPTWNEDHSLPIPNYTPETHGFLNVEIARLESYTDPGTSYGVVIVGRARVPLPKEPNSLITQSFDLVRPDGKGNKSLAGDIILSMEVRRSRTYRFRGWLTSSTLQVI